ncbi:MAG: cell division protein [Bacteroidales bacterium]|nr:cell division protein [Bacteroidales bacterium]
MKTLVKIVLLVALAVYLVFAFADFSRHGDNTVCSSVNYTIADSLHAGFITVEEADRLLRASGLYPVGRTLDQVDGLAIEQALRRNSYIDSVSCYKSPNGVVNVLIEQRLPLLRVLADNGDDYYMDQKGNLMTPQGYVADLIVATGHIDRKYARSDLLKLGRFLHADPFWNAQVEQIHVLPNHHLRLVPRVGGHTIEFGTADSISQKFRNLYTFYEKVLPQVGWNKYTEISVEHVTQIVGKKGKS